MSSQTKSYLLSFVIVAATALLLVKAGHLLGYLEQRGFIRLDFDFLSPQPQYIAQNITEQPAEPTPQEGIETEYHYSWEQAAPEDELRETEDKERHLQLLSAEIDLKLEQMQQAEENLQQLMYRQSDPEESNAARLAALYSEMPESDAARIFETLDNDAVILLLQNMENRKASAIMALLSSEKVKSVTAQMLADPKQRIEP